MAAADVLRPENTQDSMVGRTTGFSVLCAEVRLPVGICSLLRNFGSSWQHFTGGLSTRDHMHNAHCVVRSVESSTWENRMGYYEILLVCAYG